jgi:hypothetical protein
MGGKAITNSIRMNLDKYNEIKSILSEFLNNNLIKFAIPNELPQKQSFGDIDILYIHKYDFIKKINDSSYIDDKYIYTNEIVKNGDVISINFFNYQIDFIKITNENFDIANNYFSYGDLGAILGYIFSYYNLKFGQDGLWTYKYDNTNDKSTARERIILSKNSEEIFNFIGLKVLQGNDFNKIEDIFEYIISSKYFNKKIFNFLNSAHRKRNDKREMYKKFIEYINKIETENKVDYDRKEVWNSAIIYFNKTTELKSLLLEIEKNKKRKERYNGKLFLKYVKNEKEIGLKKKEFENLIIKRNKLNNFNDYIDNPNSNIELDLENFFIK